MELKEFVRKWNGKRVDFDGKFGAQCVDLFRQYCKEVWQIEQLPPVVGAKDFVEHAIKSKDVCLQTDDFAFSGDVIVYDKTPSNPYGHICILLEEFDSETYLVFEQDGFAQDGAKIRLRPKENVKGIITNVI